MLAGTELNLVGGEKLRYIHKYLDQWLLLACNFTPRGGKFWQFLEKILVGGATGFWRVEVRDAPNILQ